MAGRVFIVDDEETVADALRELLVRGGFEVAGWARTAEDAVRAYSSLTARPDVILMDHRLPGKNGIEAMADIRRLDPSARVVFVSADFTARNPALAAGAVGFVLKPFKMTEFLDAVHAAVKNAGS